MRALLAQLASVQGQPQANAERAIAALAAHPEVELAVFPELFLSGYTLSLLPQTALRLDSPELRTVAEAARNRLHRSRRRLRRANCRGHTRQLRRLYRR